MLDNVIKDTSNTVDSSFNCSSQRRLPSTVITKRTSVMEKGDRAFVFGLQQRPELNGKEVTLLDWDREAGRWSALCRECSEGIKIKPINLKQFPPVVVVDALKAVVRGGNDTPHIQDVQFAQGQITNMAFSEFVRLVSEIYSDPQATEEWISASLIEHIGKFGDARLVYTQMKQRLDSCVAMPYGIFLPDSFKSILRLDKAEKYITLMLNLRQGTLAWLRSKQASIRRMAQNICNVTIQRDDPAIAAMQKLCEQDGSKSMTSKNMKEELIFAGMSGEITIMGEEGIERVTFAELYHRVYVEWLVEDVLSTLDSADAKTGTLGEWHRILAWESQLTAAVFVSAGQMMLDISDDFQIDSWIEGLSALDLTVLEDIPGVDLDRRILRLVFFAEKALKACLLNLDESKRQSEKDTQTQKVALKAEETVQTVTCFENGNRVVLINLRKEDTEDHQLRNGMKGRVVSRLPESSTTSSGHKYLVAFSNLELPHEIHQKNLQLENKLKREKHACARCGKEADHICTRCNLAWYCDGLCQKAHFKEHKQKCEVLGTETLSTLITKSMAAHED
jgi:MYND finger